MGSGKTISALAIGAALRRKGEISYIVVLCPVNVKKVWEREAIKFGIIVCTMTHNNFKHFNYEKHNTLLIVDEAHNFRTPIVAKKYEKMMESQKSYQLLKVASSCKHVVLLTGTPIVNNPLDLRNLVMAMNGERYIDATSYNDPSLKGETLMKKAAVLTHSYMDYEHESLPDIKQETHDFYMNSEYQAWYETVEQDVMEQLMITNRFALFSKRSRAFWNGVRRASNGRVNNDGVLESPKLEWLCKSVLQWKKDGEKAIVYSAWKTYGMSIVQEYIQSNGGEGVRLGIIDGDMPTDRRTVIVNEYNLGHLDVLLFTAAASEGMNLLATRHVVILEPHWNLARIDQAMSRARRMNSHAQLPPEKRNITVHHMLLHKTSSSELQSIDDMMIKLSFKKKRFIRSFNRMVGVSITSDSSDEEEDECEDEDTCDYDE